MQVVWADNYNQKLVHALTSTDNDHANKHRS